MLYCFLPKSIIIKVSLYGNKAFCSIRDLKFEMDSFRDALMGERPSKQKLLAALNARQYGLGAFGFKPATTAIPAFLPSAPPALLSPEQKSERASKNFVRLFIKKMRRKKAGRPPFPKSVIVRPGLIQAFASYDRGKAAAWTVVEQKA